MASHAGKDVQVLAEALKKAFDASDAERTKDILGQLETAAVTLDILKKTGIGKTVGAIRKTPSDGDAGIAGLAKGLGTSSGAVVWPVWRVA